MFFAASLVFLGVIIGLTVIYIKSLQLSKDEENQEAIHTETTGMRLNDINLTLPFVRVSLYSDFFVISYYDKIVFRYSEISKIAIEQVGLSKGIRIYHYKYGVPEKLIIWSTDNEYLFTKIQDQMENITTE